MKQAHKAKLFNDQVAAPLPPGAKLIQAHLVIRHGDRSPLSNPAAGGPVTSETAERDLWNKLLPTHDTLSNLSERFPVVRHDTGNSFRLSKWQRPFGHLTQQGLLQSKFLGKKIKSAYGTLISSDSVEKNDERLHTFRCFSTDTQRTIQTTQGILAGMFPLENDKISSLTIDPDSSKKPLNGEKNVDSITKSLNGEKKEITVKDGIEKKNKSSCQIEVEVRSFASKVIGSSGLNKSDAALRKRLKQFNNKCKTIEISAKIKNAKKRITLGIDAVRTCNISFGWMHAADWAITRYAHKLPLLQPYLPPPSPTLTCSASLDNKSEVANTCLEYFVQLQHSRYKSWDTARLCSAPLIYEIGRNMTAQWNWPKAEKVTRLSKSPVNESSSNSTTPSLSRNVSSNSLRSFAGSPVDFAKSLSLKWKQEINIPQRLTVYVGHDTTILPLLATLVGEGEELDFILAEYVLHEVGPRMLRCCALSS